MATYSPSKITKDGNTYNFTDATKIPLSGTNSLAGSIVPSTNNAYDFGSSTYKLRYIYANTAYVTNLNLAGKTIGTDANSNMVYDGHIVDTIEEQGNGYIRYSNGLQICWGFVGSDAVNWIYVLFPKPFKDATIYMTATQVYAWNDRDNFKDAPVGVAVYNNSTFYVTVYNTAYWGVNYYAIGNWK